MERLGIEEKSGFYLLVYKLEPKFSQTLIPTLSPLPPLPILPILHHLLRCPTPSPLPILRPNGI